MSFFLHGDFVVFGDIANIATFTSANFPSSITPASYAGAMSIMRDVIPSPIAQYDSSPKQPLVIVGY